MKKKFNKQQKHRFCCSFALYGELEKAAMAAGSTSEKALEDGFDLLQLEEIKSEIKNLRLELQDYSDGRIEIGLESIAYNENCSPSSRVKALEELQRRSEFYDELDSDPENEMSITDMLDKALQNMNDASWEDI